MIVGQGRGETRTRVFAFSGWGVGEAMGRAKWARLRYRQRFGVETSYRQTNQDRGWTTGVSVAYRLLLEGLAQVVRRVWVNRTGVIAARGLGEKAWVSKLPLWLMLDWLRSVLDAEFAETIEIRLGPTDATPITC